VNALAEVKDKSARSLPALRRRARSASALGDRGDAGRCATTWPLVVAAS
jgi:hypothetical protein